MDMNAYLSMFIDESNDHLQSLNENLLKLESDPEDISIVQVIFRSAHTLKGMSATMGFEDLASLTHEMENVLDLVRNNKLKMDSFIFDTLFKGLDALETMVQDIINGGTGKADVSAIVTSLQAIVKSDYKPGQAPHAAAPVVGGIAQGGVVLDEFQTSVLLQSIESGHSVFHVVVTVREDCMLRAVRAYMVFDFLERNGEVVKSHPSVQDIEQEKFDRTFTVFTISSISEEELRKGIESVSEIELAVITPLDRETLTELCAHANISSQPASAASLAAPLPTETIISKSTNNECSSRCSIRRRWGCFKNDSCRYRKARCADELVQ